MLYIGEPETPQAEGKKKKEHKREIVAPLAIAADGLTGKVKPGDMLAYRIRVEDNRDVPEAGLKPQVSYYPSDRWLIIKVVSDAKPIRESEILAKRDDINSRLEAIKADLSREKRQAY